MNTDRFAVRAVVVGLVVTLAILAAGMVVLAFAEKAIPDQLDRLAVLCGGAIAGILAKTSSAGDDPQAVTVVNQAADPVPVDPAP